MADSTGRALRLLTLLQARPVWPGGELADRLGVTTRTLRRDVERVRRLGYPVSAQPGRAGGYRLGRGGRLPPLLLGDDEAVAVALGLRAAADGSLRGIEEAALGALAALDQVLPPHLAERVRAVHASTVHLPGRQPDPVDWPVLLDLARACRQLERIRFEYRDGAGRTTLRWVEPLRLVGAGPRWYLVGRDVVRDAWRTFRADRLSGLRSTGGRFVPRSPPDPVALVARGMAVDPYPVRAVVRLHVPVETARRLISGTVGICRPDGDAATIVELGAGSVPGLAAYLGGLPCACSVLDPPELRRALRRHGLRLARQNR